MTRFIAITSGKGGVGKTTTSINLGTSLTNFGRDVIVIDGNLSTANVGLYLGAPIVPVTIHDVVKGKSDITEAVYMHPSGLKIVPGSISIDELKKSNYKQLREALATLLGKTEVVIIDSPPGLGKDTLAILKACDETIIVTNPELPAVTDALKTIKVAERLGTKVSGIVLTKVNKDKIDMSIENVEALLEKPVIGIIPHDDTMRKAVRMKHPITYSHPNSAASIGYKKLAANLLGEKYEEDLAKRDGLFMYMMKLMGLR